MGRKGRVKGCDLGWRVLMGGGGEVGVEVVVMGFPRHEKQTGLKSGDRDAEASLHPLTTACQTQTQTQT